ncbi:hypothetical protein EfmJHP36_26100 [Enterococcus faecium]|nr:hypothetical protein EfmJHP36_26100 [Enterococcus faecium]
MFSAFESAVFPPISTTFGESQRKDGRYLYKYIDSFGEPQFVYSWKLVATDRVPAGKRDCISLREKIAELQKDIHDGIDVVGKKMTLCQLYAINKYPKNEQVQKH